MRLFKHKFSGKYYRLIKKTGSNVNLYLEVDKNNNAVVKSRGWSFHPQEQKAIITGFDKLVELITGFNI